MEDKIDTNNNIIESYVKTEHPIIRKSIGLAGIEPSIIENMDFSNKIFKNNDFHTTYFINCNFTNADLSQANNLKDAKFIDCNISNANFVGTNIKPEQLVSATNVENAKFDDNKKMLKTIEKLKKKGNTPSTSFFHESYRKFVRLLGGNIKWYTPPKQGTRYEIPSKLDINHVIELAPSSKINSPNIK